MLQNTKSRFQIALLVGLSGAAPLMMAGCGGGGSPLVKRTPVLNTFAVSARFSAPVVVTAPADARYSSGDGVIYTTADDFYVVDVSVGAQTAASTAPLELRFGKTGTTRTGDSFNLAPNHTFLSSDKVLVYHRGAETYVSQSGTLKIDRLVDDVGAQSGQGISTVSFTLSNVVLRGTISPNTGFTLNGGGKFTVRNVGGYVN